MGHFYVVTAAHVIGGGATWVRINKSDEGVETFQIPADAWVRHPDGDDVAVAPLRIDGRDLRFWAFPAHRALTEAQIDSGEIGVGDESFFVGRFVSADGGVRNQPSARFGNVSMLPVPVASETGLAQESFLVEARSLSGYSGSPVFVYARETVSDLNEVSISERTVPLYLLGVDWCHLHDWQLVHEKDGAGKKVPVDPKQWVKTNTGMAGVVPAWKLTEILETEELREMRKHDEADLLAKAQTQIVGHGTPDIATESEPSEFERFEDLTRKLVNTPKPSKSPDGPETA
jgi:hypothetical protein